MQNSTLIAAIHLENAKCNYDKLYKIIKDIKPEIIFDELLILFAEMYFSDSFEMFCANSILLNRRTPVISLEVKCLKKFKQNHNVDIIPVDIDLRQKLAEHVDVFSSIFLTFNQNENYRTLDNERDILLAEAGFSFLNSNKFLDFLEQKNAIEKIIIES